jgi:hypothetical protein
MVQIHPGPPRSERLSGAVAQLGERGLCKPEVVGSIPISSTKVSREAMPREELLYHSSRVAGPKQAGVGFYPAVFDNRISFLRYNA